MHSTTSRGHGAATLALGLLLASAATPMPASAESTTAIGNGTLQASARIDFRIVIPAVLHVADSGDGLLRGSLRSKQGALRVSVESEHGLVSMPVRQSSERRGLSQFESPTGSGLYTVASP